MGEEEDAAPFTRSSYKQTLIDQISGNLIAGDLTVKIHAAREIRSLIRHHNSSHQIRAKFASAGVIQPLVLMLYSRNHDARHASLLAVLNLASRNERNKEQIVTSGAIPPLVDLLNSHTNTTLRELATAAILTLSTAQPNKQTIINSGVIPLLVQILSCGTVQARVDAVTALYNLTTSKQQPTVTPDAKAIPPLINLLKECKKSSKFAEKTTFLIKIVLKSEEGRLTITNTVDGILTLVETIEDGSLISTEHALTAYGTDQGQDMARALLDLLRDSHPEKRPSSMVVEKMVHDIAARVDGLENTGK